MELAIVALSMLCLALIGANVALVVVLTRRGIGTQPVLRERVASEKKSEGVQPAKPAFYAGVGGMNIPASKVQS